MRQDAENVCRSWLDLKRVTCTDLGVMNKLQQLGELLTHKDRLTTVLQKVTGQVLIKEETGRHRSSFLPSLNARIEHRASP